MNDILTIARWYRRRLVRGRALWITGLLALVPALLALLSGDKSSPDVSSRWEGPTELGLRFIAQLAPALHLANALGEELELRTYTYLWSRPIHREALLLGKLLGALPILLAATLLSIGLAWPIALGDMAGTELPLLGQTLLAAAATCVAASCFAIGIGALVPKHPFVLALGVLAAGQVMSVVPNVANLSISHHARALAGRPDFGGGAETPAAAATWLAILAFVWLVVAVWRARKAELGAIDV